jgi:hypothetical protein
MEIAGDVSLSWWCMVAAGIARSHDRVSQTRARRFRIFGELLSEGGLCPMTLPRTHQKHDILIAR